MWLEKIPQEKGSDECKAYNNIIKKDEMMEICTT
jgi:hypothetical protein